MPNSRHFRRLGNGKIDLEELMAGLHSFGFSTQELEHYQERLSILYAEGFELDFALFCKVRLLQGGFMRMWYHIPTPMLLQIVCPGEGEAPDLGELLLQLTFTGGGNGGAGELSIVIDRAMQLLAMDDGGTPGDTTCASLCH